MTLIKPSNGAHNAHETGVEDRGFTVNGDILSWTDALLYEWDEDAKRFQRWSDDPPGWIYVYFGDGEPGTWVSLDVAAAEMHTGTWD